MGKIKTDEVLLVEMWNWSLVLDGWWVIWSD